MSEFSVEEAIENVHLGNGQLRIIMVPVPRKSLLIGWAARFRGHVTTLFVQGFLVAYPEPFSRLVPV
jgi:hypothetical protein